jgi:putative MATE family efflux protein
MGVSGAALTSVISQGIGGVISLWFLMTDRTRLRLTFKNFRLDGDIIWRMIKIGIPASINGVERSFSQLILIRIMATFGTVAMAGHTLGQRVEMFMFMPAMGFGQAAGVLAGQNLGADEPERAEKTAWLGSFLIESIMVIGSVVVWFWAEDMVRIFNSEPGLVTLTSTFLRISIASMLMMGFMVSLMQCLMGIGDTLPPMLVSMLGFWLVQLPLAYFLPKITDLGVYGVRWALVAGMAAQAVAFMIYFRTGKWKRKKV